MAKEKYKRFRKAALVWLRACVDLVTLTGHAAGDVHIYARAIGEDAEIVTPSVAVDVIHLGPIMDEVDGLYESDLVCSCFSTSPVATLDMVGAIEAHATQDSTAHDASFASDNVKTIGLRSLGPEQSAAPVGGDAFSGVYVSGVTLRARWMET